MQFVRNSLWLDFAKRHDKVLFEGKILIPGYPRQDPLFCSALFRSLRLEILKIQNEISANDWLKKSRRKKKTPPADNKLPVKRNYITRFFFQDLRFQ